MKTVLLSPEVFHADGGIARIMRLYLKALCETSTAEDVIVSIALNDKPGHDPRLGRYSTHALRLTIGCARSKLRFIRSCLQQSTDADRLVCGHLHQLPIAWLMQRLRPDLRYYLVAHGIEVWRPYTALEKYALLGAHRILCVSEYTRRQMLRFCPALEADRLVVVPNTLDPFFNPLTVSSVSSAPFGSPRILTVSRLSSTDTYKGVDTLIEAIPGFLREYPRARLRVVGSGDDLPRLQAIAQINGVTGAVDFTGRLTDEALWAEYAICDIFALPSRKEGFGLVYLEAMTYGKSCLGARAGGIPEVINDQVGTLAEYGNIPEISAALIDLTSHPRDSAVVQRHAGCFAFPVFKKQLKAALN